MGIEFHAETEGVMIPVGRQDEGLQRHYGEGESRRIPIGVASEHVAYIKQAATMYDGSWSMVKLGLAVLRCAEAISMSPSPCVRRPSSSGYFLPRLVQEYSAVRTGHLILLARLARLARLVLKHSAPTLARLTDPSLPCCHAAGLSALLPAVTSVTLYPMPVCCNSRGPRAVYSLEPASFLVSCP